MKHIILAVALLAWCSPAAFATERPRTDTIGGTFALSGSAAFVGGAGTSTSQMEAGNLSWGHASVRPGAQQSVAGSDSYGIGRSTGHGAFTGFGSGLSGAYTHGRF